MANRIMLNQTSYHGAGAIAEIANEAKAHAFKKAFVCSDPDLMSSMPKGLTASTGMDALTHAIEGYTTRNAQARNTAKLPVPWVLRALMRCPWRNTEELP